MERHHFDGNDRGRRVLKGLFNPIPSGGSRSSLRIRYHQLKSGNESPAQDCKACPRGPAFAASSGCKPLIIAPVPQSATRCAIISSGKFAQAYPPNRTSSLSRFSKSGHVRFIARGDQTADIAGSQVRAGSRHQAPSLRTGNRVLGSTAARRHVLKVLPRQ